MTSTTQGRGAAKKAAESGAKSPKGSAAGGRGTTGARGTAKGGTTARGKSSDGGHHEHDLTITIPVDRAAGAVGKAVALPVGAAQRILPAAGGLPLYLGLGALGIAGVLEWPVAAGIGVGYAILRRGGPLNPHPRPDTGK